MDAWRSCAVLAATLAMGPVLGGCAAVSGGPERLYSVTDEVAQAKTDLSNLRIQYDTAIDELDRIRYRNEAIARRMYIIDVEYSQYEAALTSERQKFGFASAVVQQGLTTAGVLVTPVATTKILSGLAGAVGATKGFYDSEIIIAKTIQIAQGQMRAQRDIAAKRILLRRGEPITTYPLSAALSDLEEYYRAGTLNSGLIKAAEDAGVAASTAAADRTFLIQGTFSPDNATRRLRAYAVPGGVPNAARIEILNDCLVALGYPPTAGAYMTSSSAAGVRMLMIQCALGKTSRFDFGSAREKEGSHADDENRGSTYCNQGTSD